MEDGGIQLPSGYRLALYETIDSTNSEALRLASRGEPGGLWIRAARQEAGKGRVGREWVSSSGNLYASLLIRPHVPLTTALQLSLLAGVAAYDALASLASGAGREIDLRLKWPNDILLGTAKLGGILLESTTTSNSASSAIIIGTGINLAQSPGELSRPAASLAGAGVTATAEQAFAALAWTTAEWIALWREGEGFATVRSAWLDRAQPIGNAISVKLGGDLLSGTFLGIDETGALRLSLTTGEERRITAGDVAIGAGA